MPDDLSICRNTEPLGPFQPREMTEGTQRNVVVAGDAGASRSHCEERWIVLPNFCRPPVVNPHPVEARHAIRIRVENAALRAERA